MASYTTNLNLKKPAGSENVAIGDINNNMDTIDQAYGTLNSKVSTEEEQTFTGDFSNVTLRRRANVIYCSVSSISSLDADWQTIGTTQFYNPNRTLMGSLVANTGKIIKLRITNTGSFQAFAVGGAISSNIYIQDTAIIN